MQNDKKRWGAVANSNGLPGNKWRRPPETLKRIRWERKANIFNIFLVCENMSKTTIQFLLHGREHMIHKIASIAR
jgi:hypothetical protein